MITEQSYNFQQHVPEHLAWEHRSKCIQEELDYIGDPEIICLQVLFLLLLLLLARYYSCFVCFSIAVLVLLLSGIIVVVCQVEIICLQVLFLFFLFYQGKY